VIPSAVSFEPFCGLESKSKGDQGKITKAVDALKPAAGAAEAVRWNAELKGFGVRARRGGTKSYVLHYRAGSDRGAQLRKVTIGRHGSTLTPEIARSEAKQLFWHGREWRGLWRGEAQSEYRRLMGKIILPALGEQKVVDVGRAEITKLHHANHAARGHDFGEPRKTQAYHPQGSRDRRRAPS
jgi:hypothetical protein